MCIITQEEDDEDGDEDVEVINELIFDAFEELALEQFVPGPGRDERQQHQDQEGDLGVEEAGDQGPVQTHDDLEGVVSI